MTNDERRARCAWVCFLTDLLDGGTHSDTELLDDTAATLAKLQGDDRASHLRWRGDVSAAIGVTLQAFCPGRGDCCDPVFWPPPT